MTEITKAAPGSFVEPFGNNVGLPGSSEFLVNPDGSVDLNDSSQPAGAGRTDSVFRRPITRPPLDAIGQNSGADEIQQFLGFLNDGRPDPTDAIFDFRYNPTNVNDFGLKLDSLRLSAKRKILLPTGAYHGARR